MHSVERHACAAAVFFSRFCASMLDDWVLYTRPVRLQHGLLSADGSYKQARSQARGKEMARVDRDTGRRPPVSWSLRSH